jgi:hypothetical protein
LQASLTWCRSVAIITRPAGRARRQQHLIADELLVSTSGNTSTHDHEHKVHGLSCSRTYTVANCRDLIGPAWPEGLRLVASLTSHNHQCSSSKTCAPGPHGGNWEQQSAALHRTGAHTFNVCAVDCGHCPKCACVCSLMSPRLERMVHVHVHCAPTTSMPQAIKAKPLGWLLRCNVLFHSNVHTSVGDKTCSCFMSGYGMSTISVGEVSCFPHSRSFSSERSCLTVAISDKSSASHVGQLEGRVV